MPVLFIPLSPYTGHYKMKYFIMRLLQDSKTACFEVDYPKLDSELACWQIEELITEKDYMLFVLSDENSQGHLASIHDFFMDRIVSDKDLMQKISANILRNDSTLFDQIKIIFIKHGVPYCMVESVYQEILETEF